MLWPCRFLHVHWGILMGCLIDIMFEEPEWFENVDTFPTICVYNGRKFFVAAFHYTLYWPLDFRDGWKKHFFVCSSVVHRSIYSEYEISFQTEIIAKVSRKLLISALMRQSFHIYIFNTEKFRWNPNKQNLYFRSLNHVPIV